MRPRWRRVNGGRGRGDIEGRTGEVVGVHAEEEGARSDDGDDEDNIAARDEAHAGEGVLAGV